MNFTYKAYAGIIKAALESGYKVVTVNEFVKNFSKNELVLVLRHDLDKNPHSMYPMANIELGLGVKSSVFVRVMGAEYNPLGYGIVQDLQKLEKSGFEIGLHTNFLEFATYTKLDPLAVLSAEYSLLSSIYNIKGISCHRDINYQVNSLPYLQDNWKTIKEVTGLEYEAYDETIFGNLVYVNEGLNPHLNWRNYTPLEIIKQKKSIYMNTHNHWWYDVIPFLS